MASTLYMADVPTFATLIAAYPSNGAALAALPAGTRVYVEDMRCTVMRDPGGKYWIPERTGFTPVPNGTNAHWYGPNNSTVSTSANQTRKIFRPYYMRMPGFRPATVPRYALYFHTPAGVAGAGTDSGQIRIYGCNPDCSPIEGAAPLFVWDFNSGGTGGAATLSLVSSTTSTRIEADIVGGAVTVPAHFYIGFVHDLATTAPTMGTLSTTGTSTEYLPGEISGTDLVDTSNLNRSQGYTWTQGGAWTIGDTQVWPAGTEYCVGGNAVVGVYLKVTG